MELSWHREFAKRLIILWPLKSLGTTAFMTLFFWAYFTILNNPTQTPVVVPAIWLDHWIGFVPAAFPIYASLWVYVSLPPALMKDLRTLLLFGLWISLLCLFCLAIFWAFPTRTPDFGIDWNDYPGLAMVKGIDASGNACPSLHVASAVFSAFWLDRIFREMNAPRLLRWISAVHCIAIIWSTIATLQHVAIDALSGAVVGLVFAAASLYPGRKRQGLTLA
jgi:hypothetical protein